MDQKDESELKALISLTDEPDNVIFSQIVKKILSYGTGAIPFLEERWENSFDSLTQQRILNIIHNIQFDTVCTELDHWIKFDLKNLFAAFMLITRYQYPDVDEDEIKQKIEEIRKDIWLELNEELTALEKVKVINHILYDIHKFSGNVENFHAPQNSYLNTLLETRKGNPLSLGILYIIISQQLNIPVYGVNLPEHFVLAYTNRLAEEKLEFLDENEVLFYINPFNKGAVFSRKEVEQFINQLKLEPLKIFFKPCSNLEIIRRLINNLIYSYNKLGHIDKINELELLMKMLNV
ncbi:MAG: transglutaminase-like domain-containing protein [Bacteroidales bacterium]